MYLKEKYVIRYVIVPTNPKVRYKVCYMVKLEPNVLSLRYVNVPKKTTRKTLITYLNPTYLRCFSLPPEKGSIQDACDIKNNCPPWPQMRICKRSLSWILKNIETVPLFVVCCVTVVSIDLILTDVILVQWSIIPKRVKSLFLSPTHPGHAVVLVSAQVLILCL